MMNENTEDAFQSVEKDFHPLSELFPRMERAPLDALVGDVSCIIGRRRRPRPPRPLNSFDGDSGADANDALIRRVGLKP